jgi:hypothetical protein
MTPRARRGKSDEFEVESAPCEGFVRVAVGDVMSGSHVTVMRSANTALLALDAGERG